jgi:hypothetical protein
MGYLFLTVALAAGITKGYCGKKTSFAVKSNSDSMIMNVLRMVLCIVIGFLLLLAQNGLSSLAQSRQALLIAALSGVASAVFVVSWLLSVKVGAYMMVEVFLLLGVTVPIVLCRRDREMANRGHLHIVGCGLYNDDLQFVDKGQDEPCGIRTSAHLRSFKRNCRLFAEIVR